VAFANADGGILIVGIKEEEDLPHRAEVLVPIENVSFLEESFRNIIIDCIEPRLPFTTVKSVALPGGSSGILLIEVQPSRLGSHRVTTSLELTIRREDKSVKMTMAEIQDMAIRNARAFLMIYLNA
jgi:predicted HTH transcriptional regulator